MSASPSVAKPLLTAFRASNESIARSSAGPWMQSLITLLGCGIPLFVCWYLASIESVVQFNGVELTHPDLVAGAALFLVVGWCSINGFYPLPRKFTLPFLAFVLSTLISGLFSIDKVHAIAALIQEVEFFLLAWAFAIITDVRRLVRIVDFVLFLFAFETIVAIWQFSTGNQMPTGTFFVHQQYAFFTSFAAAMAFAMLSSETRPRKRSLYMILLGILLVGSLLGLERAPWIAFAVGSLAVAWFSGKARKKLILGCVVSVVAVGILVATVPSLREVTIARIAEAETKTESENSLLSRLVLWKVAYDLFTQNPILGIGPKNYQLVVAHYATLEELKGFEHADPHNVWIGTLAEQGIVGFVTYVALTWAVINLGVSELRKYPDPGPQRSLCLAYIAYFFFWLTMSYPYFQKEEGHIHFLMIGLILGLHRSSSVVPARMGES